MLLRGGVDSRQATRRLSIQSPQEPDGYFLRGRRVSRRASGALEHANQSMVGHYVGADARRLLRQANLVLNRQETRTGSPRKSPAERADHRGGAFRVLGAVQRPRSLARRP